MANPRRHPLLGTTTRSDIPARTADTKTRPRRHPTFFVSSAGPSPALDPLSVSHSPEITPVGSTVPAPSPAAGPSSNTANRLRRRSEGFGGLYHPHDAPSTDLSYPAPMIDAYSHTSLRSPPQESRSAGLAGSYPEASTMSRNGRGSSALHTAQTSPARSRRPSASYSIGPRRPSRASLAALRSALQEYHVEEPHTPERRPYLFASAEGNSRLTTDASMRVDMDTELNGLGEVAIAGRSMSTLDLKSAASGALGTERMDALVEIHRVLYRGRLNDESWESQGAEVKRVIERWFEADCGESSLWLQF